MTGYTSLSIEHQTDAVMDVYSVIFQKDLESMFMTSKIKNKNLQLKVLKTNCKFYLSIDSKPWQNVYLDESISESVW